MPKYVLTDPQSGRTVTIQADTPPNQQQQEQVFTEQGFRGNQQQTQSTQQQQSQQQSIQQRYTHQLPQIVQAGVRMGGNLLGSTLGGAAGADIGGAAGAAVPLLDTTGIPEAVGAGIGRPIGAAIGGAAGSDLSEAGLTLVNQLLSGQKPDLSKVDYKDVGLGGAAAGATGSLLGSGATGLMNLGNKGIAGIIGDIVDKTADSTPTQFPLSGVFNPVKENISSLFAPGRQKEALNILKTISKEAGLDHPFPGPAEAPNPTIGGAAINDMRQLFNKTYGDSGVQPALEKTLSNTIRGIQIADNPDLGKLLPMQRFLTYNVPNVVNKLPLGIGSTLKAVEGLGSQVIPALTPDAANPMTGGAISNLLRMIPSFYYGASQQN